MHLHSPEPEPALSVEPRAPLPTHVAQNIETMAHLHGEAEGRVRRTQRAVETVTGWIGQPLAQTALVGGVVAWCALNTVGGRFGVPQVDAPPFQWLQLVVSVSALFVTTMVLTTQNRLDKRSSRRESLGLQINLVAEQKIAKLIALVEELRRDSPAVRDRVDLVAKAMELAVDPDAVMSEFDRKSEAGNIASVAPPRGGGVGGA